MQRRIGFTLVELLVVVAIITALLAILLPSINRAMAVAQKAVCMSNTKQIGLAFRSYQADHRGISHNSPNHGRWKGITGDPLASPDTPWLDPNDGTAYWGVAYGPYVSFDIEVFRCPVAGDVDDWWEHDQPRYRYSSYGENIYAVNTNISQIANASERVLFQDAAEQLLDDNGDTYAIPAGQAINMYQWRVTWIGDWPNGWREYFRHDRRGNIMWYDLHGSDIEETDGSDVPNRWYSGK